MGLIKYIITHQPEYFRNAVIAILLVAFLLISGTIGFILIEGYSVIDAFYMTTITVSTVGFGELKPLSETGRIFASFFIIVNIGTFAYAISTLASFIIDGTLRKSLKESKMNMSIENLSEHVIVCGYGRNGKEACDILENNNIPFVVIDKSGEKLHAAKSKRNFLYIHGDAASDDILIRANIYKAKSLITTLSDDADNLFVTLTARNLNTNLTIVSRASKDTTEVKLKIAGADHVVMPEKIGGAYMAKTLVAPDAIEFFKIISGSKEHNLVIEEFYLNKIKPEYSLKTILDYGFRKKTGINIIGLKNTSGKYIVNPNPDLINDNNCILIVMGEQQNINGMKKYFAD